MLSLGALATPAAIVVWAGCSSSSSNNGLAKPDPGGTFGAEIVLHIVGGGRVVSTPEALDCPGGADACFHRFIVDPGAKPDIALKAETATNWRFSGWTFNNTSPGTRGKGGDSCQPFTRASSPAPGGVDLSNPEIKVPTGSTGGTPPKRQEGLCASDVPLAYDVTATFVYSPIPDAGQDVEDTGYDAADAGAVPSIFDPPALGATAGAIFYKNSRLYWQWDSGGQSAIGTGFTSGGSRTDYVALGPVITAFNVNGYVAFQSSNGFGAIPLTGGSTIPLAGAPSCAAVTTDSSYAYCRTTSDVRRWDLFGTDAGAATTILASGLPSGPDLGVDSSYLYYSATSAGTVNSVLLSSLSLLDGGTPTPNIIASGQSSPSNVQVYSSYALWQTSSGSLGQAFRSGGGAVTTLDTKSGLRNFVVASGYVWYVVAPSSAQGASSIWRVSYAGGTPTLVHAGLTDVRGITSDGSYVYYTQGDGKVYRLYGF